MSVAMPQGAPQEGVRRPTLAQNVKRYRVLLLMLLPAVIYYVIFAYLPMLGIVIAFQNYSPYLGFLNSPWVGLKHFTRFFSSVYFTRLLRNSILLSVYNIAFFFPAPILLALLLNEVRAPRFKRAVQTITYLPHFISLVVVVAILFDLLSPAHGVVNRVIVAMGGRPVVFVNEAKWFRTLYIGSGIWQEVGWGSIIYLAAMDGIDQEMYESASIDGANRLQKMLHITLPGISSTIIVLLIMRVGQMLNASYEKIILMYNSSTYETADVIQTYVYRNGLLESNYSFGVAVGLFNSVINFICLVLTNALSRRVVGSGLF